MKFESAVATASGVLPALLVAGYLDTQGVQLEFLGPPERTVSHLAESSACASAPGRDDAWHREAARELESISRLTDGWDGEESIAPDKSVIARASEALILVYVADLAARRVLATNDGGIGIYCFEKEADPGRGVRYFRIGLLPDDRTQFESGLLGADEVDTVTVGSGDVSSLEIHIEEWAGLINA